MQVSNTEKSRQVTFDNFLNKNESLYSVLTKNEYFCTCNFNLPYYADKGTGI